MAKKPPKDDSEDVLQASLIKSLRENGYSDEDLKRAGFDLKVEVKEDKLAHSRSKLKIVK